MKRLLGESHGSPRRRQVAIPDEYVAVDGFSSDCSDEAAELGVDSHEWRVLARGAAIKSARLLVHNQISPIEVGVY